MKWTFVVEDILKNKNSIFEFEIDASDPKQNWIKKIAKDLNKKEYKINKIRTQFISRENISETITFGRLSLSPKCFDSYFDFTRYDLVFFEN